MLNLREKVTSTRFVDDDDDEDNLFLFPSFLPRNIHFAILQEKTPLRRSSRRIFRQESFFRIVILIVLLIGGAFAAAIAQQAQGFRSFRCILQPN